MIINANKSDLG